MLFKTAFVAALLSAGLVGSSAAAPASTGGSHAVLQDVQIASFWAQPYPYGYRWRVKPRICRSSTCATPAVRALGSLTDPVVVPLSVRRFS